MSTTTLSHSHPQGGRQKQKMVLLVPRNQGIWQDLKLRGGAHSTTGWTVQLELPEELEPCMSGTFQQELDGEGDTATASNAAQSRESRGDILLCLLPSFCPLVYYLCPYQLNLTRRQWAKRQPGKCRPWEPAPCDTEIGRKGQGRDLSTNRPMASTRCFPRPALVYLPLVIPATAPCPLVLSPPATLDYRIFAGCALYTPVVWPFVPAVPSAWNASLSLLTLHILQILVHVLILGACLLSYSCDPLTL